MADIELWQELGQQLRVDSLRSSGTAGSGHPTSSMSAADLIAVLMTKYLKYDFTKPGNVNNDHLIFSKGHASPLLYSMYRAAGVISESDLLSFRQFGSKFQGHPTPAIDWVDIATGSLGQGLPIAAGIALAGKYLDRIPYTVWVLCGDSEMAEGSMWEALELSSFSKLDNLIAIVDVNRLGQRGETRYGWDLNAYTDRAKAFGWHTIQIDGHDFKEIDAAYTEALNIKNMPTLIVAKTIKGKGNIEIEDMDGFHGKPLENIEAAIEQLGGIRNIKIDVNTPSITQTPHKFVPSRLESPKYTIGDKVPTRKAYGDSLAHIGSIRNDVVALDAEVSNSTYSDSFQAQFPDRFFEMFIAEQQLVASAIGMQVQGWKPFASTFAAFFARAFDFIRMAAVSEADIKLVGSHAGVSIGPDGPSQMGLEDISSMRSVHGSTVLYPSDPNQTSSLVNQIIDRKGIVYLRTTREATPVLYDASEDFPIGGSKILLSSPDDVVTVVAAGITLHEAVKAANELKEDGIHVRLIDLYSIKPIDSKTLLKAAKETGKVVTVEDHWPQGGLGEAVLEVLSQEKTSTLVTKLAVSSMPTSGSPEDLLSAAGIDSQHITEAVKNLIASS